MKKEDIIDIINRFIKSNTINQYDLFSLASEFVYDVKKRDITSTEFNMCCQIFGAENILDKSVEHFKIKFQALSVFDINNRLIALTWQ